MKQFSSLVKLLQYSLCLALLALSSVALANEFQPSIEPLNVLPLPNDTNMSVEHAEKKPLLLLAQAASSKAEAAQVAKSRHGGKVLSVRKSGNGWQVKLLLDDGRVKLVYVEGSGQAR